MQNDDRGNAERSEQPGIMADRENMVFIIQGTMTDNLMFPIVSI